MIDAATRTPSTSMGAGRRGSQWVSGLALAGLLVLLVSAWSFRADGGRWLDVTSPSMGQAAPVGTLVFTEPVTTAALRVGDIIAFHPPNQPRATYTHRVTEVTGATITTRGDINGAADPWVLRQSDLIGKVTARLWGLGWLTRVLPLLVAGGAALWAGSRWLLPPAARTPARQLGVALLIAIIAAKVKPFVGVALISAVNSDGVNQAAVVSTGLLPIQVRAMAGDAPPLDLVAGQVGVITATGTPPGGAM